MHRLWMLLSVLLLLTLNSLPALILPVQAQDGLNLPTELYILRNDGVVQRYGLGASGVQTVTPDDEFVVDFRVAPDGNWLAYRTQTGLFLHQMHNDTDLIVLEGSQAGVPGTRGRGETIAWSPSSDAIAYTTLDGGRVYFRQSNTFSDLGTPNLRHLLWSPDGRYLAAEANDNIWWIFRRESGQMILTSAIPGAYGAAWVSLTALVFPPIEGGLNVMDLAAGNQQTVLLAGPQVYRLPWVQDDGSILIYVMNDDNTAALSQVTLTTPPDIFDIGVAFDMVGMRWAPGGGWLVAFQGGALALVNPQTGQGLTLPISGASAYGWGPTYPDAATGDDLPTSGYFTAQDATGVRQVWRLPADGTLPQIITTAENDVTGFAIAPDNRQMVYVSNSNLWLADVVPQTADNVSDEVADEANNARLLVELGIDSDIAPAFSPDGGLVYYRDEQPAPDGNDDNQAVQAGIWRYDLNDDSATLFVSDSATVRYYNPNPSNAVSAMLVQARLIDDTRSLVLVDTNSGELQVLGDYASGTWLAGTQIGVMGRVQTGDVIFEGLHIMDVNNRTEPPLTLLPTNAQQIIHDFVQTRDGQLRVLSQQTRPGTIAIIDIPLDGGTPAITGNAGYLTNPQLSPDGTVIIGYTHGDGRLISYDIANDTHALITQPFTVRQFNW